MGKKNRAKKRYYGKRARIRIFCGILIGVLSNIIMSTSVLAASVNDGLEVSVEADKCAYTAKEEIELTLMVKNTNSFSISDILLENVIPKGYKIKNGYKSTDYIQTLKSGETVKVVSVCIADDDYGIGNSSATIDRTNDTDEVNEKVVKTGDKTNFVYLFFTCALAGIAVVIIVIWQRRHLLTFLILFVTGSCLICGQDRVFAQDKVNNQIEVETTVFVENKGIVFKGIVNYSKSDIAEGEEKLDGFKVDDNYYIANMDSDITFIVNAENVEGKVNLYDDRNNRLGIMHDDGKNGDAVENDGIFTCKVTVNYSEGTVEFCAKTEKSISNKEGVKFVEAPTEELFNVIKEMQQSFYEIDSKYCNGDGTVSTGKYTKALDEAAKYAKELIEEGKINKYGITEYSVVCEFNNGLTMLYAPKIEGTFSGRGDADLEIYTFQPVSDWLNELEDDYIELPDGVEKIGDLVPTAANRLTKEFAKCSYLPQNATKNLNISLDSIRNIRDNQIVLWEGHGTWGGEQLHSILMTNNTISLDKFDSNSQSWDEQYYRDVCAQRVILSTNGEEGISSKYIEQYCSQMDNTYIYLGPCHSGRDSVLAQAFLDKGASAVIGNTNAIICIYGSTMEYMTTELLTEYNPDTDDYYTLGEALDNAKEIYGKDDSRYNKYYNKIYKDEGEKDWAAEPVLFGGAKAENYRLGRAEKGSVFGKVFQMAEEDRVIEGATINVYREGQIYTTLKSDNDGNYIVNLPVGTYYIEILADGYIEKTEYILVCEGANVYNYSLEKAIIQQGYVYEYNEKGGLQIDKPIVDAIIELTYSDENEEEVKVYKTDNNGYYCINNLNVGTYTLKITKEGYVDYVEDNFVVENSLTDVNFGMSSIETQGVCRIRNVTFNTLEEAVQNSKEGDTINLYGDDISQNGITINHNLTITATKNVHTGFNAYRAFQYMTNNATLTLNAVEGCTWDMTVPAYGELIVNNNILNIGDGILFHSNNRLSSMAIVNHKQVNINTEKRTFYYLSHGVVNYDGGKCLYNDLKVPDIFDNVMCPVYDM